MKARQSSWGRYFYNGFATAIKQRRTGAAVPASTELLEELELLCWSDEQVPVPDLLLVLVSTFQRRINVPQNQAGDSTESNTSHGREYGYSVVKQQSISRIM
ncbi:hypothetical protein SRHO_G00154080 [Serrasalmus rhombeus]